MMRAGEPSRAPAHPSKVNVTMPGDLSSLADQRRHDVTLRHTHPRFRNDLGDYPLQVDTMSAVRLV